MGDNFKSGPEWKPWHTVLAAFLIIFVMYVLPQLLDPSVRASTHYDNIIPALKILIPLGIFAGFPLIIAIAIILIVKFVAKGAQLFSSTKKDSIEDKGHDLPIY